MKRQADFLITGFGIHNTTGAQQGNRIALIGDEHQVRLAQLRNFPRVNQGGQFQLPGIHNGDQGRADGGQLAHVGNTLGNDAIKWRLDLATFHIQLCLLQIDFGLLQLRLPGDGFGVGGVDVLPGCQILLHQLGSTILLGFGQIQTGLGDGDTGLCQLQ